MRCLHNSEWKWDPLRILQREGENVLRAVKHVCSKQTVSFEQRSLFRLFVLTDDCHTNIVHEKKTTRADKHPQTFKQPT